MASLIPAPQLQRMLKQKVSICLTLHFRASPQRLQNLANFHPLAGTILYGTDLGIVGPPPGVDVDEVKLMMMAKMTFDEVVWAETGGTARRVLRPGDSGSAENVDRLRGLIAMWHCGQQVLKADP